MGAGENGLKLPCKQHSPSATPTSLSLEFFICYTVVRVLFVPICVFQLQVTVEPHGFELCGFIYTQSFFNKYLNSFQSKVGSARMWRLTLHCPFYIGDLSSQRFSYTQGVLEPIPHEYRGTN